MCGAKATVIASGYSVVKIENDKKSQAAVMTQDNAYTPNRSGLYGLNFRNVSSFGNPKVVINSIPCTVNIRRTKETNKKLDDVKENVKAIKDSVDEIDTRGLKLRT